MQTFDQGLTDLINKHCVENESDTPDWILAQYIRGCLNAFTVATQQRENYYGRDPRPTTTPMTGAGYNHALSNP